MRSLGRVCSGIEFHGIPNFLPEQDRLYEGRQHFLLHELAYFHIKPISFDRVTVIEDPNSKADGGGDGGGDGGSDSDAKQHDAPSRADDVPAETPIRDYTISFHIRIIGHLMMHLPLFTVIPDEEDTSSKMPAICLQPNMQVTDNMSEPKSRKVLNGNLKLTSGKWELLTVCVENSSGQLSIFLNGEAMLEVTSAKHFNASGPFVMSAERGLKMFTQTDVTNVQISLRHVHILPTTLPIAKVRMRDSSFHIWRCRCGAFVGSGAKACWKCTTAKRESAEPPLRNPDERTKIRSVVAKTFKDEVLRHCVSEGGEQGGAALVLFYSKSSMGANKPAACLRGGRPQM